jgi:hypothetical protein
LDSSPGVDVVLIFSIWDKKGITELMSELLSKTMGGGNVDHVKNVPNIFEDPTMCLVIPLKGVEQGTK